MGHIHVCPTYVSPCEDPEDQMVVSIDSLVQTSCSWATKGILLLGLETEIYS